MKTPQISRRSFLSGSAALLAGAGIALSGCSNSSSSSSQGGSSQSGSEMKIRLAVTSSGHVFNAIAEEQGYLKDEGLTVETSVLETNDDAFQALFSGKVDVTSTQGTNLPLVHIGNGQDLVVWGGYMITGCMPVIAKTGTKWNGVEDLVGKTIACSGNEFAVFGPLIDKGHSMNDVTTIVLSNHNDRTEAVASGKADYAILGTNQNYNVSQKDEVEVMCYCSDITPNYSCCRMNATSEFLNKNEDAAKALIRAWLRAQDWYENNKTKAEEMVAKQLNTELAYVQAYMENEHYRLNLDPYKSSVVRAWKWMGEMGVMPDGYDKITVEDHINTKIYETALKDNTEKYGSSSKAFYDKMNEMFKQYNA